MSIHPHDVRELLGPQSITTPVSDEQVERMVAVLNACRAQRGSAEMTPHAGGDPAAGGRDVDRSGRGPSRCAARPLTLPCEAPDGGATVRSMAKPAS